MSVWGKKGVFLAVLWGAASDYICSYRDFRGAVLGAHSEVEPQASPFVPDFPTATERPVRNFFLSPAAFEACMPKKGFALAIINRSFVCAHVLVSVALHRPDVYDMILCGVFFQ